MKDHDFRRKQKKKSSNLKFIRGSNASYNSGLKRERSTIHLVFAVRGDPAQPIARVHVVEVAGHAIIVLESSMLNRSSLRWKVAGSISADPLFFNGFSGRRV